MLDSSDSEKKGHPLQKKKEGKKKKKETQCPKMLSETHGSQWLNKGNSDKTKTLFHFCGKKTHTVNHR